MVHVLFLVGLVVLLLAVLLFARTAAGALTAWWYRHIEDYARWMTIEFESMVRDLTRERARGLITYTTWGGVLLGLLLGAGFVGRIVAVLILGGLGYFGPRAFVYFLRWRRLSAIDDQLVDALTLMSNGLRAGLGLQQALELVVREMKPPISDEFARMVKEIHLGRLTDDALRRFRERVPLEDVNLSVESILTLRETGGNLSETFEVIAHTVTERKKVQGKIKTMTAQGMTQGIVMCLMPIGMLLLFAIMSADLVRPFFTTPLGILMLVVVFALDALGLFLMFKLVKVDV